ncbi:MAG TPA: hypothetical protein VE135_20810 [Pyrinomonadaceae bacterium]|nr:hypothetical protein [Pyrinomonadaceae bacterium]
MNNTRIKSEADLLVLTARLPQLLADYPGWFIGGSYSYDLMCWRDLDVYVLDPGQDLKQCFDVAYEVTRRLAAIKSRFTNNCGGEPDGFYWGIKLGDIREGAWKLDLWFLDQQGYDGHASYSAAMIEKLAPESRSGIMAIKEAYWRRPEFRDTVTSDLIYRAVLESGVRDIDDFERFLLNRSSA